MQSGCKTAEVLESAQGVVDKETPEGFANRATAGEGATSATDPEPSSSWPRHAQAPAESMRRSHVRC